ncbi:hypothetical protein K9N50_00885 [bacterium]|nr:hypothetical protein [bacterium]
MITKKIKYQKPELIEIQLLDESAIGESGFGDEPPLPSPPGGAPPRPDGMPVGNDIPPGP